jgi:hypothetical protein
MAMYTTSLLAIIIYLKLGPSPPIMNGPGSLRFVLKHTLFCVLFRDPARPRIYKYKKHGHYPYPPLRSLKSISSRTYKTLLNAWPATCS